MGTAVGTAATAVGLLVGLVALAGTAYRLAAPRWRAVALFLRDWHGTPARGPWQPGVPGVLARLQAIEESLAEHLRQGHPGPVDLRRRPPTQRRRRSDTS